MILKAAAAAHHQIRRSRNRRQTNAIATATQSFRRDAAMNTITTAAIKNAKHYVI